MNNTQQNHLRRAVEIAKQSTCRVRHGVVIAEGPRVISVGVNTNRNSPLICSDPGTEADFHAERNALKSLEGRDLSKAVLYSARVNKAGNPALAKPCEECESLIEKYGIKRVYFTEDPC